MSESWFYDDELISLRLQWVRAARAASGAEPVDDLRREASQSRADSRLHSAAEAYFILACLLQAAG